MNWFEKWFNTSYYHVLYKNRDYKEAEEFINNLVSYLKLPKAAKVMDLACGKGRHAVYLNKLGLNVKGVDLAKNSIEEAREHENDSLYFHVHDMREVYKADNFNAVFNLFTSFGYFEDANDNVRVFDSVHKQLKEEGYFILDYLNVKKAVKELIPNETITLDGIDFHISKRIEDEFIKKRIQFFADGKDWDFEESVKILDLNDFKNLYESSNFKLIHFFGDYSLSNFEDSSDRLILLLQK